MPDDLTPTARDLAWLEDQQSKAFALWRNARTVSERRSLQAELKRLKREIDKAKA